MFQIVQNRHIAVNVCCYFSSFYSGGVLNVCTMYTLYVETVEMGTRIGKWKPSKCDVNEC